MDDLPSLAPKAGTCAINVRAESGQFAGHCPEPPTRRDRYKFSYPKPSVDRVELCGAHAAALTRSDQAGRLKLGE